MKDNLVETLVGFGVIVVAAIFVFYGYSVTDSSGGDGYVVSAEFDRVDGLTIGSDVRMSGIKIGTVTACLLYTSPSPRDRQKSRMPSSA